MDSDPPTLVRLALTRIEEASSRQKESSLTRFRVQPPPKGHANAALFDAAHTGDTQFLINIIKRPGKDSDSKEKTNVGSTSEGSIHDVSIDLNARDAAGATPLMYAAVAGHTAFVSALVIAGADVNAQDDLYKRTAAHWAVQHGKADTFECLVGNGAKIDARDSFGKTPVHIATDIDSTACLKVVVEAAGRSGVKGLLNATDVDGLTPLSIACVNTRLDHLRILLLSSGVDVLADDDQGRSALQWAACSPSSECLVLLLETMSTHVNKGDARGYTPLHMAAMSSRVDATDKLLAAGANPHATDKNGATALHWATSEGCVAIMEILIAHGARIDATDAMGAEPLHYAAQKNHQEAAALLIDRGASLDCEDFFGRRPLVWSVVTGDANMCAYLLEKGASIGAKDANGSCALHYAAHKGHADCCRTLLASRANANAVDLNRQTPLIYAAQAGHAAALDELLLSKPIVGGKDSEGKTALHWACARGHVACAESLIASGAVVDAGDAAGNTPLHEASRYGKEAIVPLLASTPGLVMRPNADGLHPLHLAASGGHVEACAALLQFGANVLAADGDAQKPLTPTDYAQRAGHAACTHFLRRQGGHTRDALLNRSARRIQRSWREHRSRSSKQLLEEKGGCPYTVRIPRLLDTGAITQT
eukprot:Opistho-2@20915